MRINVSVFALSVLLCCGTVQAQESPLLERYRSRVLEYDPDVKAAGQNIGMHFEMEKTAKADFKPKLSASGNFNYTGNPLELTLGMPNLETPLSFQGRNLNYGASLSLVQPVYAGGAIRENYRMAGQESRLAANRAELVKSDIAYQADIRYWNTVARLEAVAVADTFKQSVQRLVDVVRERVRVEYADRNDLLMAEVRLNEAEYRLMQARNDYEVARLALNSFAGVALDEVWPVDSAVGSIETAGDLLSEMKGAEGRRPELRMARNEIDIRRSALKLDDARFKPQLYVGIDGSYSSPGYNFRADLDPNYAVYAKLSVPVFEWGKRRSVKRTSEFRISMAEEQMSKVEDQVGLEIRSAYYTYSQAVARVRLTGSSLQKAYESEALTLDRYREGSVSIVEVLEAQTYAQQARFNYVQSKANAQISHSGFVRALGLYSFK